MAREFIIRPNCSLNRTDGRVFLFLLGVVMLIISLVLLAQGFWPVLPFMGADLLLVMYAFRKIAARCRITERVLIDKQQLLIIHEEEKRQPKTWTFPLHWVRVDLETHHLHATRLVIGMQGTWIELAAFLNNDERASLAEALRDAVITMRQPDWVKGVTV